MPKKGIVGTELKKTIVKLGINTCEYLFVSISKFSGPHLLKNGNLGTKYKKTIIEFKISSLEYPFISSFFKNKTVSSFGNKFFPKRYFLETKFRKIKCPSTLFWVSAKQLTKFCVTVGHSGSLWVIVAHSTV